MMNNYSGKCYKRKNIFSIVKKIRIYFYSIFYSQKAYVHIHIKLTIFQLTKSVSCVTSIFNRIALKTKQFNKAQNKRKQNKRIKRTVTMEAKIRERNYLMLIKSKRIIALEEVEKKKQNVTSFYSPFFFPPSLFKYLFVSKVFKFSVIQFN